MATAPSSRERWRRPADSLDRQDVPYPLRDFGAQFAKRKAIDNPRHTRETTRARFSTPPLAAYGSHRRPSASLLANWRQGKENLVPLQGRVPRQGDFSKEECRSWAFKLLASMASLSRAERDRVLKQAIKVNAI
jgi:hypothetical protein